MDRDGRTSALRARVATGSRSRLAASRARLRAAAWPVTQCAVGAGAAWALAQALLSHERPFFACVAAVVCLSTRAVQRLRRVAELAVGVTVGVLVGELLVGVLGAGAWQIGVVVGVALLLAVALDGGQLLVSQAGVQAVFVVALPRTPGGDAARWQDALLGGLVALAVAALLPTDPWRAARRAGRTAVLGLALALREAAGAVRDGDPVHAAEALATARETQSALDDWAAALAAGRDTARLSALRRDRGGRLHAGGRRLHTGTDRATRNTRVLVRRVLSALEVGDPLPERLPDLLEGFADLLCRLADDPADHGLVEAVAAYGAGLRPELGAGSLSGTVVLAQLRTAVVDLLEGLGLAHDDARRALPALG